MGQNELFSIGEVSRLFHISVGILRHYDKIGLVRPEYIDPATGYRYYSTRQFECLNMIRYLRALDMPLEKIAAFLHNREIDGIQELLLEQKAAVEQRRQALNSIERKIDNRLRQLEDARSSRLHTIQTVCMPPRRLALLKKELAPKSYLDLEHSIRELEQEQEDTVIFLGKVGVGLTRQALQARRYAPYELVFVILDAEDQFKGDAIHLPAETCLTIRFRGSHEQAPHYYETLLQYLEDKSYTIAGFSKEITMIDDGLTSDVTKFVTEIQIPIYEPYG